MHDESFQNFRSAFSPDPTDCRWVSEDARCKLSENLAIFIPIFLIIFKLDTDQMKQPRLFRFMRPEAKWNACRIDKRSDDDKIGLDRNVAIQVNFERFVWGHWGKTVLISSRQFALTGLFLWNLLPVPS